MEAAMEQFERDCRDAPVVQERLLRHILEVNSGVEYLKKYAVVDVDSFRTGAPVIRYQDIESYIERMASGDSSPILSNDPVISFSLSSGTTGGKQKLIPETQRCTQYKRETFEISGAYRDRIFPGQMNGVGLAFVYAGKQFDTKLGVKIGAGSTNYYRSEAFKHKPYRYSSPDEVVRGFDWRESTYCHLLCGLLRRDEIDYIVALFAFTLVEAVRTLESEWPSICQDIREGTLNGDKVKDISVREAVLKMLRPNPELADLISEICGKGTWSGILHELWPRTRFIMTVVTGAMRPYIPSLRDYAGSLPITGVDYVCSEGTIGINMEPLSDPESISFTVVPSCSYIEFIPLGKEDDDEGDIVEGDPVGVGGVEIGKLYEVVVTNIAGLYRFRIGDVVKVTGFFHKSPRLSFCRRRAAVLSINIDKTDEEELQMVVSRASRECGIEVSDFTSCTDLSSQPGHYVVYFELKNAGDYSRDEKLQACCTSMDRSLNNPYARGRAAKTIGALELVIVKQGTFLQFLNLSPSPGQYKTPRCIGNSKLLTLLRDGAVQSYLSPESFPLSVLQSWKPSFTS